MTEEKTWLDHPIDPYIEDDHWKARPPTEEELKKALKMDPKTGEVHIGNIDTICGTLRNLYVLANGNEDMQALIKKSLVYAKRMRLKLAHYRKREMERQRSETRPK